MFFSADDSSGRSVRQRLGLLIRRLLEHRAARLALANGLGAALGYGLFAALYLSTRHALRALAVATVLVAIVKYVAEDRQAFADRGVRAFVPVLRACGMLLLANMVLLEGLARLGRPPLIAQAIALPVMAALSYLVDRYWVFRSQESAVQAGAIRSPASRLDERAVRLLSPASIAACLLLAVVIMKGRLYGASTDLAEHYQLANALAANWSWPEGAPLSSGMHTYPPLSHYLGAVVGLPFRSALVGMNVVAVAAIFVCYLLLARALSRGGAAAVSVAVAIVVVGLWIARMKHAAEGFEVYGNFFYAQLVGEAAFLAAALGLSDEKLAWPLRWSAAAVLTLLAGWLYPIAAVEIAMAYLAFEALRLMRRVAAERRFRVVWALPVLVGAATLPPLVYWHPYFRRMAGVAVNNGGLDLNGLDNWAPEFAAALLVVGLVLGLSRPRAEHWRRPFLFLATAACATAAPALLQAALFEVARVGSPYAVKKYAFATITLLIFGLGALAGAWLDGRGSRRGQPVLAVGLPPLLALVTVVAMPPYKPADLDRFVHFEKNVKALLRDPKIPKDAFGNTVSLNNDFSAPLNFALNLVDLRLGLADSLAASEPTASTGLEPYVVIKDSPNKFPDECAVRGPGLPAVSFISLKCGALSGGEVLFSEDLSKLSSLPSHFASGWSVKEPTGVWSDGPKAQIALHFDHPTDRLMFSITGSAFLPTANYVQHILVSAGGSQLAEWIFDGRAPWGTREIVIPSKAVVNGDLELDFAFPDAIEPNVQVKSGLVRHLSFFVTNLSIENMRILHPGDRIDMSKLVTKPRFMAEGWNTKEPSGVWTSGNRASMLLPIAEGAWDPTLVLEGSGFFPTPGYRQRVKVRVGSTVVAEWTMDGKSRAEPRQIVVPRRLVSGGALVLDFEFPDATSPAAQHLSADSRDLAFFLTAIGLKALPAGQEPAGKDIRRGGVAAAPATRGPA